MWKNKVQNNLIGQYEVFYRGLLIGYLMVEVETEKHCYKPVPENVEHARKKTSLIPEMLYGTNGYTEPIPFFQNRLMNMNRNGLKEINYQTDYFLIREID